MCDDICNSIIYNLCSLLFNELVTSLMHFILTKRIFTWSTSGIRKLQSVFLDWPWGLMYLFYVLGKYISLVDTGPNWSVAS